MPKKNLSAPHVSPQKLAEFEQAAQNYVKKVTGISVEVNEDALVFLDHYVRISREKTPPKTEIVLLPASALGVLFGQIVLQKLSGHWYGPVHKEASVPEDPLDWRIAIDPLPFSFSPVAMAMTALQMGEAEDVDDSLALPPAWQEKLSTAMERLAPVTAEYYYSFTGRFESLCYVTEITAEWLHQEKTAKRKKSPSKAPEL